MVRILVRVDADLHLYLRQPDVTRRGSRRRAIAHCQMREAKRRMANLAPSTHADISDGRRTTAGNRDLGAVLVPHHWPEVQKGAIWRPCGITFSSPLKLPESNNGWSRLVSDGEGRPVLPRVIHGRNEAEWPTRVQAVGLHRAAKSQSQQTQCEPRC